MSDLKTQLARKIRTDVLSFYRKISSLGAPGAHVYMVDMPRYFIQFYINGYSFDLVFEYLCFVKSLNYEDFRNVSNHERHTAGHLSKDNVIDIYDILMILCLAFHLVFALNICTPRTAKGVSGHERHVRWHLR